MKLKFFFCQFPNPWALRCQGWVVIPQNVKKRQNHCTLLPSPFKGAHEIFNCSDFHYFWTIKPFWVDDFVVKILTYYFNFWWRQASFIFWCASWAYARDQWYWQNFIIAMCGRTFWKGNINLRSVFQNSERFLPFLTF